MTTQEFTIAVVLICVSVSPWNKKAFATLSTSSNHQTLNKIHYLRLLQIIIWICNPAYVHIGVQGSLELDRVLSIITIPFKNFSHLFACLPFSWQFNQLTAKLQIPKVLVLR